MRILDRREALVMGASAAAGLLAGAQPSRAAPADAVAEIAKFTGGRVAEKGMIAIVIPEIAENGNSVPISISVDNPMTVENHVTEVIIVAEANPLPEVAKLHFTPLSGRAAASTRIRLAASQNIVVVAKTNDGRLFTAEREVKVTVGGCGG
jgi:sulfur-oxidizing protein SoxY